MAFRVFLILLSLCAAAWAFANPVAGQNIPCRSTKSQVQFETQTVYNFDKNFRNVTVNECKKIVVNKNTFFIVDYTAATESTRSKNINRMYDVLLLKNNNNLQLVGSENLGSEDITQQKSQNLPQLRKMLFQNALVTWAIKKDLPIINILIKNEDGSVFKYHLKYQSEPYNSFINAFEMDDI